MEQQPIYNPIIPFTGIILGGLQDGKMIIVQGQVPGHAKRFGVDFQCGSIVKPRSDIAFHFNVRYDEGTVVCNTLERECWGTEQRKPQIPIPTGSYFELIFHVRSYCFQVSVNGQHFVEYCHRLSYNRVDTLVISGDVHVNALTFRNPNVPPPYAPPAYTPIQASNVHSVFGSNPAPCKEVKPPSQVTVSNPMVPYQAYIGSIKPQQKIKIIGTVKAKPYRFTINLKVSYYDNIALHINQRFDENAVVRNSRINQNWGTEERSLPFLPFLPGQTFEMQIVIQPTCYKILVNGRHLFNFNHRIQPLNQIDQLEVTGDISLSLVQY
ncbi:galectin-9-like isoform X1 [Rhincodon typus]|uniref:galectin-9-like isoform X1 n=2 Tax=Rhincodon typus TaxID=259920 RepID=UPI00202FD4A3|nr:galectin-9-like isoform X1 [Rhincodon typus]